MGVTPACIAAVRSASGDALTEAEAVDLLRRMEQQRKALEAAGNIDNLDARLRQLAAADAERAQIAAALAKKHAAQAAIAYDRSYRHIETLRAAGLDQRKAFLAFLEGGVRVGDRMREGVAQTALAFRDRYFQAFNLFMVRNPEIARLVQNGDPAFASNVVREMDELRQGGEPGRTGDQGARELAKLYADIAEMARLDLNRYGAPIGRLDGWSPHAHDSTRVVKVNFEEWRDFILPELDAARTFGDMAPEVVNLTLRDIHRAIITGVDRRQLNNQAPERLSPANLANSLAHSRYLHFRDADAYLRYAARFGNGTIHDGMLAHIMSASKAAAQLQMLGPNPEATLTRLRGQLMRDAALDPSLTPTERQRLVKALDPSNVAGTIGSAWAEVSGLTSVPVSERAANIGTWARSVQAWAKLGGMLWSSITDLPVRAAALTFQGKPIGAAWAANISELMKGRGKGEQQEIAAILNAGLDGMKNQITAAGIAEDVTTGRVHKINTTFFRWAGATWWQDIMKSGSQRATSAWMGHNAARAFADIPRRYQLVLRQHGIGPAEWELIRGTAWKGEDGNTYVTPDRLEAIPRTAIATLAKPELDALDAGLAERVAKRDARNAQEAEWVRRRTERFAESFQNVLNRLRANNASADQAAQRRVAELRDRMAMLDLRLSELAEFHQAVAEGRAWADAAPDLPDPPSTNAALSGEAPATGNPGARPFAPRAERYLDQGDASTIAARAEGELRQRLDALRRAIGNISRAAGRAEKDRLKGVLSWWNKRQAEVNAFADQMEARAAERDAATKAELGEWNSRVDRVLDEKRLQLELTVRRFYADEMGFAVLEADAATRRLTLQGTRPGTVTGELLRAMAQFKGFPVAFTNRVLGRALLGYEPTERMLQARNLGTLLGGLFVMGYLAMTIKDVLRGWSPRDPSKPDTILAALLQSGGAGIYGDFLFAQANRFGNSAAETVAGPLGGALFGAINLAAQTRDLEARPAQALNLALSNTPFASLWFARPVLDFLILNSLRESLSPGFIARQDKSRREDFGQERLIPASLF
jgi:hypothetical protein